MKIIHTADWHLGNVFHGHTRYAEHEHFLKWLLNTLREQQPDVLLLTGDVYDSANPSAQAEKLLYNFLLQATSAVPGLQVVLTAGNHDSARRLEAPAELLKQHNIYVRGTIRMDDEGKPDFDHYLLPLSSRQSSEAECVCFALPYLRTGDYPSALSPEEGLNYYFENLHKRLKKSNFKGLPVVVAAHFYAAGAEICENEHSERLVVGGQDCVSAEVVGRGVSYTALGHIHKSQPVRGQQSIFYAGSALPMSFSEINYSHGVMCIDLDTDGKASVQRLTYTPLRTLRCIPANKQQKATVAEVMEEIAQLPTRSKHDEGLNWPYLEINIEEKQPEPSLMHDVMEALADKAVLFCRMVRVRQQTDEAQNAATMGLSAEAMQSISPLKLACDHFRARYGEDMPEPLIERFKQAEHTALNEEQNSRN